MRILRREKDSPEQAHSLTVKRPKEEIKEKPKTKPGGLEKDGFGPPTRS